MPPPRLPKQRAHDLFALSNPLARQRRRRHAEEERVRLRRHRFGQHRLPCAWRTEQQNALGRRAKPGEQIGAFGGQNHRLGSQERRSEGTS